VGSRMRSGGMVILGIAIGSSLAHAEGDGQELFENKCKLCQSIKGDGGKQADKGGSLDGVGSKHDRAWLEEYLQDPKAVLPESKMPKLKYPDEELKALVDYRLSLK
jgi:cytochrome c2